MIDLSTDQADAVVKMMLIGMISGALLGRMIDFSLVSDVAHPHRSAFKRFATSNATIIAVSLLCSIVYYVAVSAPAGIGYAAEVANAARGQMGALGCALFGLFWLHALAPIVIGITLLSRRRRLVRLASIH